MEERVCDICWFKGGKSRQLSQLVTCRTCQVCVHPECYDLGHTIISPAQREGFQCWACRAVGTTVKFRERDQHGKRIETVIQQRPTECCLCGVVGVGVGVAGVGSAASPAPAPSPSPLLHHHAMHPLYDDYGTRARQIKLPNNQPAWVHTLCALIVGHYTGGLVYACTQDGSFGTDADYDDDNDNNDDEIIDDPERIVQDDDSVNSLLLQGEEQDLQQGVTHHYAYVLERWYGKHQGHVRLAREHAHLKCKGCGLSGEGQHVYRFAIQCMANTKNEYKEFRKLKLHTPGDCYEPWHVGCARYTQNAAGEYPGCPTVFYFPGGSTHHNDPVCNVFCPLHAADIYHSQISTRVVHYPPGSKIAPVPLPTPGRRKKNKLSALSLAEAQYERDMERRQRRMQRLTERRRVAAASSSSTGKRGRSDLDKATARGENLPSDEDDWEAEFDNDEDDDDDDDDDDEGDDKVDLEEYSHANRTKRTKKRKRREETSQKLKQSARGRDNESGIASQAKSAKARKESCSKSLQKNRSKSYPEDGELDSKRQAQSNNGQGEAGLTDIGNAISILPASQAVLPPVYYGEDHTSQYEQLANYDSPTSEAQNQSNNGHLDRAKNGTLDPTGEQNAVVKMEDGEEEEEEEFNPAKEEYGQDCQDGLNHISIAKVKTEDEEDQEPPFQQECQGITLSSVCDESAMDYEKIALVEKGFAGICSSAVANLSLAIKAGKSWPLDPCDWIGASFPQNSDNPWCKVRAISSTSQVTPLRHRFAIHGTGCTRKTHNDTRCESCQNILERVKSLCRRRLEKVR